MEKQQTHRYVLRKDVKEGRDSGRILFHNKGHEKISYWQLTRLDTVGDKEGLERRLQHIEKEIERVKIIGRVDVSGLIVLRKILRNFLGCSITFQTINIRLKTHLVLMRPAATGQKYSSIMTLVSLNSSLRNSNKRSPIHHLILKKNSSSVESAIMTVFVKMLNGVKQPFCKASQKSIMCFVSFMQNN